MQYIEAPNYYKGRKKSLFLGGGITGCPDWQKEMCALLSDTDLVVFNPRRKKFPKDEPAIVQIKWEYEHLRKARAISFWFPKETLCPIVLYELGAWSMANKPIFVGVHPEYARKIDVEIQTKLVRPEINIVNSLELVVKQIEKWAEDDQKNTKREGYAR